MARVTVEDCIVHIPNRFELVIIAAQRAKAIASGTPLTIDRDNDKDAVVSLREIADRTISIDDTREEIIQGFCKKQMIERIERPAPKANAEVEEMLAEDGAQVSDDIADHLSVGMPSAKGSLSFEGDNVEAED